MTGVEFRRELDEIHTIGGLIAHAAVNGRPPAFLGLMGEVFAAAMDGDHHRVAKVMESGGFPKEAARVRDEIRMEAKQALNRAELQKYDKRVAALSKGGLSVNSAWGDAVEMAESRGVEVSDLIAADPALGKKLAAEPVPSRANGRELDAYEMIALRRIAVAESRGVSVTIADAIVRDSDPELHRLAARELVAGSPENRAMLAKRAFRTPAIPISTRTPAVEFMEKLDQRAGGLMELDKSLSLGQSRLRVLQEDDAMAREYRRHFVVGAI